MIIFSYHGTFFSTLGIHPELMHLYIIDVRQQQQQEQQEQAANTWRSEDSEFSPGWMTASDECSSSDSMESHTGQGGEEKLQGGKSEPKEYQIKLNWVIETCFKRPQIQKFLFPWYAFYLSQYLSSMCISKSPPTP